MSNELLVAAAFAGVSCALVTWLMRYARPWRFRERPDLFVALRAAVAARAVLSNRAATDSDYHAASELYERWINLPREQCSAMAAELRHLGGIDMIRLGDALHARAARAALLQRRVAITPTS